MLGEKNRWFTVRTSTCARERTHRPFGLTEAGHAADHSDRGLNAIGRRQLNHSQRTPYVWNGGGMGTPGTCA